MLTENQHFSVIADSTPRLGDQLARMWGTPEVEYFITGLLKDIKGGLARGFGIEVANALEQLLDCHRKEQALANARDKPLPMILAADENFLLVRERFPHLANNIVVVWGAAKCSSYINELLSDTRGGKRQGFPPDVAMALFKLVLLHDKEHPELTPKESDTWTLNNV